jgi:hypothetical protein
LKCIDCENLKLEIEEGTRNTRARCSLKNPPKKGKIITWACTSYENPFNAMLNIDPNYGDDRVKEVLNKKNTAPSWCPCRKGDD